MSPFTDDDLKQLKKCIYGDHPHAVGECLNLDADDFAKRVEALLARLEAAEELIGYNAKHSEYEVRYEA